MRNSKGVVWGSFLLLFGLLWLLRDLDLLDIAWKQYLPYWPVLLIMAGVILLISKGDRGVSRSLVGFLIAFAVFGAISNKTNHALNGMDRDWKFGWNDDNEDQEENGFFDDSEDEKQDKSYLKERNRQNNKEINSNFKYEMQDFIQYANLNIEGGAGSFKLKGETDYLFEANTKSNIVGFNSEQKINRLKNLATINLEMEEGNVKIKNGNITNEAIVKLNSKPIWRVDLGIGAGKGDFDFSEYKIESLKISTGVADLDIRVGEKLANSKIDIQAGVASIAFEIPKNTGCEVRFDGALNVKSLDDLEKVSEGLYRSPNFNASSNKITINFEGGLSKVKIRRY